MTRPTMHTAEVTVFDPSIGATRVLYFSTHAFSSAPTDTPANTPFDGKIIQPATMKRDAFDSGTTSGRSRIGYGDIVLANDDGALDILLTYAFDGWPITIRRGSLGAAYPAAFSADVLTMEQPVAGATTITIKLRDRQAELDVPLQTTKYAGTNVGLDGLEGGADLQGKPKPLCFGRVTNVPARLVNASRQIYQVNDGAVEEMTVSDAGIQLITGAATLEAQTSGFGASAIRTLCHGDGIDIAAGDAGKLFTSTDGGVTWVSRTSGFGASAINAVIYMPQSLYNGYHFLSVGDGGKYGLSTDGISWNVQLIAFGAHDLYAAAFSGSLFIVGGAAGAYYEATNAEFYLAAFWRAGGGAFGANAIRCLAYGNARWVAVGDGGVAQSAPSDPITLTWASVTGMAPGVALTSVAFGLQFVAGNVNGEVSYSSDGIAFNTVATGVSTDPIRAVSYGNASYVFVGDAGSIVSTSNLVTFTLRTSGLATDLRAVTFGDALFLIGGDAGALLTSAPVRTYASLAELEDDALAPSPSTVGFYYAGGYFRLGSAPTGTVTADVVQGASASDRTAAALYELMLVRAGKSGSDYDSGDLTTLDTANSAELGLFLGEETTVAAAIDRVATSVGAFWGPDRAGVFRIQRLEPASGTPVVRFIADDLIEPLVRVPTNDPGRGLPSWSTTLCWGRSYTVQTGDVAAGVSDARRALVSAEWRQVSATDAAVRAAHPLAPATVEETLFAFEDDAQAEADRRQELRGIQQDRFELLVELNDDNRDLEMGDVAELAHARYGLNVVGAEDGQLFRVLSLGDDTKVNRLRVMLWGDAQARANVLTDDGAYEMTDDGFYIVTA